jgi:cyanophycin synthetase
LLFWKLPEGEFFDLVWVSVAVISGITNIQEDHLGLSDIHTLDDLARVKATVVKRYQEKAGILNGDDEHCIKIGKKN